MQIGLIGLGKMGFNLALNMRNHGHEVVAYDIVDDLLQRANNEGIQTVTTFESFIQALAPPRVIWLMIPAGDATDRTLNVLKDHLRPGDKVIDGGNSFYKDSIRRAKELELLKLDFLDCGTSGGMEGALNGICAMVGGKKEVFDFCEPLFKDISIPDGYLYCGASGSGHYVKMIHNGVEYGMMQAIAEGFEILHKSEFGLHLEDIANLWSHGSVVRGWLMELTSRAFSKDPSLDQIKGVMRSSGEGKWTLETALEKQIATPVIAMSLMMRYRSLEEDSFAGKVVAALRNEFGGHAVEKK